MHIVIKFSFIIIFNEDLYHFFSKILLIYLIILGFQYNFFFNFIFLAHKLVIRFVSDDVPGCQGSRFCLQGFDSKSKSVLLACGRVKRWPEHGPHPGVSRTH